MDIEIDGDRVEISDVELHTAGDVFERVDTWAAARGRCVVGVTIDGKSVAGGELGEFTLRPADAFRQLEFTTQPTAELVESLVGDLESKIAELAALVRDLATQFQGEVETPPIDLVAEAVNAWRAILDRIVSAAGLVQVDVDTLEVPGKGSAGEHHARVTDVLNQLVSAVEQGDLVLVADLLEYEVAPGVEDETAVLASLRRAATSSDID